VKKQPISEKYCPYSTVVPFFFWILNGMIDTRVERKAPVATKYHKKRKGD